MCKDFNETREITVSLSRYYQEIKKLNIGFVKLGDGECEDCDLQDHHLKEVHKLESEKDRNKVKSPESKKTRKYFYRRL